MIEYLVPPAVGALIGYFTNYVAIKMLFRPYRPYYLFGRRVPFTPGLIPAKRGKLADAIAKVVKENLLTEETLRSRLNEERIRESLRQLVEGFLERFRENSGELLSTLSSHFGEKRVGEVFGELLDRGVEGSVRFLFGQLHGKKVGEVLPESLKREFEKFLDEKIDQIVDYLARESERSEFRDVIYSLVRENILRLREFIPFLTDSMVSSFSERLTNLAVELIEKTSKSPDFKLKVSKLIWSRVQDLMNREIDTESESFRRFGTILERALSSYGEKLKEKRLKELLEGEVSVKVSQVLGELIAENREVLSSFITDELLKVIERELPVILEAVDIEGLVRERINSLPIEEVEGIVLKLIDEELRYITLMGGVLGALIGAFQLVLI